MVNLGLPRPESGRLIPSLAALESIHYQVLLDGSPLSIVHRTGFVALMDYVTSHRFVGERYRLPSRRTLGRLLDQQMNDRLQKAKTDLCVKEFISITVDCWSRHSHLNMIGMVAHYGTGSQVGDAPAKSTIIGLEVIDGEHTAENQASVIVGRLTEMDLISKVSFIVSDSGSDIRRACTKLMMASRDPRDKEKADKNDQRDIAAPEEFLLSNLVCWLPCAAHRMHLVVSNALRLFEGLLPEGVMAETDSERPDDGDSDSSDEEDLEAATYSDEDGEGSESDSEWAPQEDAAWLRGLGGPRLRSHKTVVGCLQKCRALLRMLRVSSKAAGLMNEAQDALPADQKKPLNYLADTPTRWNSTYKMLQMVCDNEAAFDGFQMRVKGTQKRGQVWGNRP